MTNDSNNPLDVDAWVQMALSGKTLSQEECHDLEQVLIGDEECLVLYESENPVLGDIDEFPLSAVLLSECIEAGLDSYNSGNDQEKDTDGGIQSFRYQLEGEMDRWSAYYLKELIASDSRSAWMLVRSNGPGPYFEGDEVVNVFPTPISAEIYLRSEGYIFKAETPSGKTDSFTDDQIIELLMNSNNAASVSA